MLKKLSLLSATVIVLSTPVFAAADADITALVTDNGLTWALVKGGMIAIGGFLVAYSFFKRIRRA